MDACRSPRGPQQGETVSDINQPQPRISDPLSPKHLRQGEAVRLRREALNWSMGRLAREAGVSVPHVSAVEAGRLDGAEWLLMVMRSPTERVWGWPQTTTLLGFFAVLAFLAWLDRMYPR